MSSNAVLTEEKNPRGIPRAPFIENVEAHIGGPDVEVEPTLKQFQDALAKYRYMDTNLTQRRQGLEEKIPDIKKTLAMVEYLLERREGKGKASAEDEEEDDLDEDEDEKSAPKPLTTTFELNDTLFAEAVLEETEEVHLWLGANVMLSYKLPAAVDLLRTKLATAESTLATTIEDLAFLREQTTVMEVNTARVYNWDVKRRRLRRERGEVDEKELKAIQ
ncbi:Prefoldin, subunit 3 [Athelia psychrophila]|uniref:Prefoldin subunit 3 n=1 Tax=Athelia psychrophila TaxID=1759441 RepID=A0A166R3X4_9AGAM|nr:Prefoldin, subunit 3 [Fibularhizoctonia sp. CBS 109695]